MLPVDLIARMLAENDAAILLDRRNDFAEQARALGLRRRRERQHTQARLEMRPSTLPSFTRALSPRQGAAVPRRLAGDQSDPNSSDFWIAFSFQPRAILESRRCSSI